ncbi:flagellar basal body rod protein FlgG [Paenibacillus sp. N1-5-1-14]|uniref:flagellar basal body rod protein FlgG n=1 Tax=Paenibacillus radicibacter TaxID=2972488 RepID=UPI002159660C|nr:flagellar basal body rod protein FlgG [Paenibacillus radicibacter]MCR8642186.1 flagellar basal body rod protein FlgG [Paenibacillus radicibacter]
MLRSMYSGVSGMRGFQTKLDVIGNNIANVNTVGFKGGRVMFKDILSQTVSGITAPEAGAVGGVNAKQIGLGVGIAAMDTIHTPGSAMTTNVPTDVRIDGDGFFALKETEDGPTLLSRAGNFTLDAARQLVNADGLFVLGPGGETITLDDDTEAFAISKTGQIIEKKTDGSTVNDKVIGLVNVINPAGLEKVGGNLYRMNQNSVEDVEGVEIVNPMTDGLGAIISGALEMSNVDLTAEFTEMIVAQRGFQANSRIITTSDEVLQEVVNLKR